MFYDQLNDAIQAEYFKAAVNKQVQNDTTY